MELKRLHMKPSSFMRFKSEINRFKDFLSKKGFERRLITSVTRKEVNDYLNESLKKVSARSRNNYRTSIGTLWQTLENEGMVERNFVKSIPMLKSIPKRNRAYTDKQVIDIFAYMSEHYPILLFFVKFVSYNFLRPLEVCRLKGESFDMDNRTLSVMVKQGRVKTKVIPDILYRELPEMKQGYLFGKTGFFQDWNIKEDAKRGHFSRQFKKVKEHFKLSDEYTLYGFRHTFTSRIYKSLRKELSPYEAKGRLMTITGHDSMKALEKYLRSIDAELAEDYSERL